MPIDQFCYHGDDKKDWCDHCNSPKSSISFGAVKPSLNPQWLAEALGASEVVELPPLTNPGDPTEMYDRYMRSRGFVRVA